MASCFLQRKVDIIPLTLVNDVYFRRSLSGALFGYADFVVTSGAPDQITHKIAYMPKAEKLYLRICEIIFPPDRVVCPLCHGEGEVFRPPSEDAEDRFETEDFETWNDGLTPVNGRSTKELLAEGYRQAKVPGARDGELSR